MQKLIYFLFFLISSLDAKNKKESEKDIPVGKISIPNSCIGLEDGIQKLKFLNEDDYPVVSLKCSNGYAILNYKQDNSIKDYFISWIQWHYNTVGPSNEDDSKSLQWKQWFIPGAIDSSMKYLISPDCNTCDETNQRQLYATQTTYWMTGTIYGCFWAVKGQHNCDVDWDTDECYTCSHGDFISNAGSERVLIMDNSSALDFAQTGICPHNVQSASHYVPLTHDSCSHEEGNGEFDKIHLKPSLGIEGKYCVCVQPSRPNIFSISEDMISETDSSETEGEEESLSEQVNIELYQSDFEFGTYRITKSGTYTIMEDITFHFNPDYDTPNSNKAWMPTEDQASSYPGADDYHDPYFMGFFAGITIEADDVILDLNGYTLQMSEHFYYQQRWFTIIELTTQYFLPGQGIGNFGGNPYVSSNIIIKNGILGLTSHHGIHGNYNKDILIENVKVQYFETHGIQFNGFTNIVLRDVEVGPTSNMVYFTGEYGHARFLLPRYQNIATETSGQTIQFYGRDESTTMEEIVDKLGTELDLAWNYVANGVELSEDDENYRLFVEAKRLFINEKGIPNGGAQYGIFLNTFGASVFTYNLYTGYWSSSATLENVKIHDMQHSMDEYVRLHVYKTGDIIINPFNAPLDVEEMFDDVNSEQPYYVGNILLDAIIASNKLSDNWGYLQLQIVNNDFLVPWALGEDVTSITQDPINIGCNSDVMIHSGKGINGLRLDGVKDITINNLEIYNLKDSTPIGKDTCGEYDDFCVSCGTSGGHFRQTQPMQIGFSGNMNQAININAAENIILENIKIDNIESETGASFGVSIWPACTVELKGDVIISNIIAGSTIMQNTYSYNDRPNKAPEVCGVRVYYEYDDYTTTITSNDANIQVSCINGHIGCIGDENTYTMLGSIVTTDEKCTISDIPTYIDDNDNTINQFLNKLLIYIPKQRITYIIIESIIIISIIFGFYYYYYRCCHNDKQSYEENTIINYHLIQDNNYGSINTCA